MTAFRPSERRPPIQVLALASAPADRSERVWRTLVCCVLLNRAGRTVAMRVWPAFFRAMPTITRANVWLRDPQNAYRLARMLRPLGLAVRRAEAITLITRGCSEWRSDLDAGMSPDDLPYVGRYAADAVRVFVDDDLSVEPDDGVLSAWVDIRRRARHGSVSVGRTTPTQGAPDMTTAEQIRPRDLATDQTVRVELDNGDHYVAIVLDNKQKAGRVRLQPHPTAMGELDPEQAKPRSVTYKSLLNIEPFTPEPEPEPERPTPPTAEETAARDAEIKAMTDLELLRAIDKSADDHAIGVDYFLAAEADTRGLRTQKNGRLTARGKAVLRAEADRLHALNAPAKKAPARKPAVKKSSKRAKYPLEITAAAARLYEAYGRAGAPGPKQHAAVRDAVRKETGVKDGPLTKDVILKACGFRSIKALGQYAAKGGPGIGEFGEAAKRSMSDLHASAGSDTYARGRNLARILLEILND